MPENIDRSPIPDSAHHHHRMARVVGSPEPDDIMAVTLLLRRRSSDASLRSLEELSAPQLFEPITREEFAESHGADPDDIRRVEEFARSYDLEVIETSPPQRTVTLSGTIAAMKAAFDVDFQLHEHGEQVYRSHVGEASLPTELASAIEWVFGLHDAPAARPSIHARHVATLESSAMHLTYKATEVAALYNFPREFDGTGECIGIIELAGSYKLSDMQMYFAGLGLPVPRIDNVGNEKPNALEIERMEVTLDVAIAGAVAPGAHIVVYYADGATGKDLYNVISKAIHDQVNKPSVLTFSWGSPESEGWAAAELDKLNELFREAANLGITICTSSGDSGSCVPNGTSSFSAPPVTDFPAASPYTLACGGTKLIARNGVIEDEFVWNCLSELFEIVLDEDPTAPMSMLGNGGASGGGVSARIAMPPYQKDADVPKSMRTQWKNGILAAPVAFEGRGVPDVAGNADINSGYLIVYDGEWIVSGGTSSVSPLWAGLIARLNQALKRRVGFLNPLLYHLQLVEKSDALRPITHGNNGGYEALPDMRWNPCTGLGVPDGEELLKVLSSKV